MIAQNIEFTFLNLVLIRSSCVSYKLCSWKTFALKNEIHLSQGGSKYRRKFLVRKIRRFRQIQRYWHICQYEDKNKKCGSKDEKRLGVQNDVICRTIFNFIKSFTMNSYEANHQNT
jgi:hypothetical protein